MKNLEQTRAANALEPAQKLKRSAISGLPALILQNGLLATAAFCNADGGGPNRKDMRAALDATASHLAKLELLSKDTTTAREMIDDLSKCDSLHLQRAVVESLAFIAYLKRLSQRG